MKNTLLFLIIFTSFILSYSKLASATEDASSSMSLSGGAFVSKLRNSMSFSLGFTTADYVLQIRSTPDMDKNNLPLFNYYKRADMRGANFGFGKEWNINGFFSTTSELRVNYLTNNFGHNISDKGIRLKGGKSYFTQSLNLNTEAWDLVLQPFIEVGVGIDYIKAETDYANKTVQIKSTDSTRFLTTGLGLNIINDKGIYSFLKVNMERHELLKRKLTVDGKKIDDTNKNNKVAPLYSTYTGLVGFGVRF
jgi:hypothetical protein